MTVCKATCQNCGLETADCRCLCREGSMGVDCSGNLHFTLI